MRSTHRKGQMINLASSAPIQEIKKEKKKYLKNLPLRNRRFFPHFFFYTRGTVLGRASRCSERDRKPNNVLISELHEVQRTSPVRATLQQHPARRPPNYGVANQLIHHERGITATK